MKHFFKITTFISMVLFIASCSEDKDNPEAIPFIKNVNAERFTKLEIGNSDFVLPKTNVDIHVQFDYESDKKVKHIFFDVIPYNIKEVKKGEIKWELKNHLVPKKKYEGKLNPHIHYHVYFDEKSKLKPSIIPAEGVYKFKITVEHIDGTKSYVTKDLNIIQKFKNLKVGNKKAIKEGNLDLKIDFDYNSGNNTTTEIKYQVWFKEWRKGERERPDGKKIKEGKWNFFNYTLPKDNFFGKKKPRIQSKLKLIKGFPVGKYWLNIYVKESGNYEAVKLSIPFEVKK